jgi:hypothetical protein
LIQKNQEELRSKGFKSIPKNEKGFYWIEQKTSKFFEAKDSFSHRIQLRDEDDAYSYNGASDQTTITLQKIIEEEELGFGGGIPEPIRRLIWKAITATLGLMKMTIE